VKKKQRVRITERDFDLLKHLGEYCAATVDSVGKIYGTCKYHQTRITVLDRAGYIRRKNNLVYLGEAGKRYLEEQGLEWRSLPTAKSLKQRNPRISSVAIEFTGSKWQFIPSWEIKKDKEQAIMGGRLLGILKGRSEYAVYNIGTKPPEKSLYNLKREMEKLPVMYGIKRAVIFYESGAAKEAYGEEALGLEEQLLLPYNADGINLMRAYGEEDLIKKAAQIAYAHGGPPQWPAADYTVDNGRQAVVLVLNDIEKRARLSAYYEMTMVRYTQRQPIAVICLEGEESFYAEKYPGSEIKAIDLGRLTSGTNNGRIDAMGGVAIK
jgi:hypothetical protein